MTQETELKECRAEFEAWAKQFQHNMSVASEGGIGYTSKRTNWCWRAWQAAYRPPPVAHEAGIEAAARALLDMNVIADSYCFSMAIKSVNAYLSATATPDKQVDDKLIAKLGELVNKPAIEHYAKEAQKAVNELLKHANFIEHGLKEAQEMAENPPYATRPDNSLVEENRRLKLELNNAKRVIENADVRFGKIQTHLIDWLRMKC